MRVYEESSLIISSNMETELREKAENQAREILLWFQDTVTRSGPGHTASTEGT